MVAALSEVLVRATQCNETLTSEQVTLAISSNVAVLGALSAALACTVMVIWAVVAQFAPTWTGSVPNALPGACTAAVAIALILATDCLGLRAHAPLLGAASVICGGTLVTAFAAWPGSTPGIFGRRPVAAAAVVAWLVSIAASGAAVSNTAGHLNEWVRAPGKDLDYAEDDRPNIVMIMLDTVRADRVGVYGGGYLTPHIDAFAESSIVYKKAISTAPWTLPAHASLFTGLYPSEHGVNWGHYELEPEFETLAELLGETGYTSFAVSNNWLVSEEDGFAQGFDAFLQTARNPHLGRWRLALGLGPVKKVSTWLGLSDRAAEDAGSSWTNLLFRERLRQQMKSDSPFFAFVNYFEAHDPYHPPTEYVSTRLSPEQRASYDRFVQRREDLISYACGLTTTFTDEEVELMAALYDAEVAYQDEVVGELLDMLKRTDAFDNSWILIISDHGELFGEGDMVFHTAGSHYKLLHVPLIVRPPKGVPPRTVESPVQPVDVFVTLVEEGGATVPDSVRAAYPLPMDDSGKSPREICVAETYGSSIIGLAIAQLRSRQSDFSKWMTWVTSVYEDGFLLEVGEQGPRALLDVRGDAVNGGDLRETRPDLLAEMMHRLERWRTLTESGVTQ